MTCRNVIRTKTQHAVLLFPSYHEVIFMLLMMFKTPILYFKNTTVSHDCWFNKALSSVINIVQIAFASVSLSF